MDDFIRNPRNQILVILVLLTFSGCYLWWALRHTLRQEEITRLSERDGILRTMNQNARRAIGTIGMDKVREALNAYDRQESAIRFLLPSDSIAKSLLPAIADEARAHGVTLAKLAPTGRQSDSTYTFDQYEVTLTGRYHDIGSFLAALGSLDQIVQVRAFKAEVLSPADAEVDPTQERLVRAEFRLDAYLRPLPTADSAQSSASSPNQLPAEATPGAPATPAAKPSIRYERGSNGQLWQLLIVPGRETPIRLPVAETNREAAEAALSAQGQ